MSCARRGAHRWLLATLMLLLTACATRLPPPQTPETLFWSGRMALNIASTPPQSLSAGFELKSVRGSGELQLLSPLGTSLAKLQWSPGQATLEQGRQHWQDSSLDHLLIRLTGAALPLNALIDWLQARPTQVEGWRADLSQLGSGRLWVQSTPSNNTHSASAAAGSEVSPPAALPQVTLRLILEH
jgi:outer membrane lipoprotein LolB